MKIVNYIVSGLVVIYLSLIIYPNFLFGNTIKYKNFTIHSTQPLGDQIKTILDQAEEKLLACDVYDKSVVHNIYVCNNFNLFSFLAPISRKAFACNYPIINNIIIANCNVSQNEAFKNDAKDQYTRNLSTLITHEATHTLIEKKIGFWKFKRLAKWKHEGYCDYVGYGQSQDLNEARAFLIEKKDEQKPGTNYKKFYIAVNYLMTFKKISFENLITSDISYDDMLKEIESAQ